MNKQSISKLFFLFLLVSSTSYAEDIYRWVDPITGHFTNSPRLPDYPIKGRKEVGILPNGHLIELTIDTDHPSVKNAIKNPKTTPIYSITLTPSQVGTKADHPATPPSQVSKKADHPQTVTDYMQKKEQEINELKQKEEQEFKRRSEQRQRQLFLIFAQKGLPCNQMTDYVAYPTVEGIGTSFKCDGKKYISFTEGDYIKLLEDDR